MLKIIGKKEILNKEMLVVEGGFGEGQKILFDIQIAEIHNAKNIHVREAINKLIDRGRMKEGVDFIDLKQRIDAIDTFDLTEFYAKQSITQAKNIFVLSERGYIKLIKLMTDDKSWDIMEEIVNQYFSMRAIINSKEDKKKELLLQLFSNDPLIVASAHKELLSMEVEPLQEEIKELKPKAESWRAFLDSDGLTTIDHLSKSLGIKDFGRNNMYKWFRKNRFLQKDNMPYARYVNQVQLFKVKNAGYHYEGTKMVEDKKTFLTAKGVEYFINQFKKEGII